jgi:two-component system, OmpR family, response regulator QseB
MQVLFVEDDAMNRRVVRDMLTLVGAEMDEAESAELGLTLLDAKAYDVVLMDLRMPGMDGLTAIRTLRGGAAPSSRTPVVVVTADTAVALRETCLASGADEVIMKPVSMDALFDAISEVLAREGDIVLS